MQNVANYTNNPETAAITLEHVWLGWRDRIALRDITDQFNSGSLTAIVGPNGAGKSTLVKGIMGVISPMRGKFYYQTCKHPILLICHKPPNSIVAFQLVFT